MYIAICDDDVRFCNLVADMLVNTQKCEKAHRVKVFHSGEELLFHLEDHKFDLLLLDIVFQPGEMSGLIIAEQVHNINMELPIIFLTDYPEYALQGYNYHPYHFLSKRDDEKKLKKTIRELEERQRREWHNYLNLKLRGGYERIPKSDIIHIEVQNHTLSIYTPKTVFKKSHVKISEMLDDLSDPRFFQPHKSYIINLEQIHRITGGNTSVLMKNDVSVPISDGRRQQFIRYIAWFDTKGQGEL